jgi:hypothetical protein
VQKIVACSFEVIASRVIGEVVGLMKMLAWSEKILRTRGKPERQGNFPHESIWVVPNQEKGRSIMSLATRDGEGRDKEEQKDNSPAESHGASPGGHRH